MKAGAKPRFVIDASIVVAWCIDDEKTVYTEWVFDRMSDGEEVIVPHLWAFEVANSLLVAERRKRLTAAQTTLFLEQLENLNIAVGMATLPQIFSHIYSEARHWNLTVYDAAYLEIALRLNLPLATLDDALKKAAKAAGIALLLKN